MARHIEIRTPLSREGVIAALEAAITPRDDLPAFGVQEWTVFGELQGDELELVVAGPFDRWSSRSGTGIWQPRFAGRLAEIDGSTLITGRISRRVSWLVLASILVSIGILGIVAVAPSAIARALGGESAEAARMLLWLVPFALAPIVVVLLLERRHRVEADALASYLAKVAQAMALDERGPAPWERWVVLIGVIAVAAVASILVFALLMQAILRFVAI